MAATAVTLQIQEDHVDIDNGIVQIALTNPGGLLRGIKYGGIDNLLELHNKDLNGGFWDLNWSEAGSPGTRGTFDTIEGTSLKVIVENEEQVELSFTRTWSPSVQGKQAPLSIDRRFQYMAISDTRQRFMPHAEDRLPERGRQLAYPEAVLLVNPIEEQFKGEVDDKYQYSCENKDNRVHGWISFDPPVGFWLITPSNEFRTGGPLKQDLTSHVNPTTLAIFITSHYAGVDLIAKFDTGEEWKKVLGPVCICLNSGPEGTTANFLWDNAKEQMNKEVQSWPYAFPASPEFPKSDQRGKVSGKLVIQDRYISKDNTPATDAFVGLASPGNEGSWQRECKGYQFWCTADKNGKFAINNIRPGNYNLYAWVPGFVGDYKYDAEITINADTKYFNNLYVDQDSAMNPVKTYTPKKTLWERYADLFPSEDLVYTVGASDYKKDWFYAQVTRKIGENKYKSTTWQIKFKIDKVEQEKHYKLRIALASAQKSDLQVRVNDAAANPPLFSSGVIGADNAIARHGIHGLYWLFNIDLPGSELVQGENTIFLTQANSSSPFQGIMYDYIRLEGPSSLEP